ncbi:hypothetical protein TVAG_168230 [Trichomonas vaginalis G3]|uniref:Uncharacterized protein n=1 Tax=Trichomonas vaginalis (strain ATCC PRA-98 / G3) TaxID=412133 RepID=A2FBJ1_TRIV3|nr:hypothetical protein TVAGG3_0129780 [Trichomonas vaginalis G3]EAX97726.1 hypothetical protein TVAG_168230 [Trichomonas vaginalis G3]KAI5546019.1 hypothetical protein TVAGG3_0129780 [Trichomonas vaginalis G3]|eukprot:XP_001310656.1 hypothetical protein [Trichomonas vaginalis G3]
MSANTSAVKTLAIQKPEVMEEQSFMMRQFLMKNSARSLRSGFGITNLQSKQFAKSIPSILLRTTFSRN